MLFNLSNIVDQNRFKHRLTKLYERGALVDLTDKSKKSLSQNGYFHLIVSYFALEYGETADYVKQNIVKQVVCPDDFVDRIVENFKPHWDSKQTPNLVREEMTNVVDVLHKWAKKQ